jgi:hypothetical protein
VEGLVIKKLIVDQEPYLKDKSRKFADYMEKITVTPQLAAVN